MSRIAIACLLLGICSSLHAADAAKPSPAGVRYLAKVRWVQDKPETNHVDKEWWGTKGTPTRATMRSPQGLEAQIEVEDLKKTDATASTQYLIRLVVTATGKDGKQEILQRPQICTIVDLPESVQIGQRGPGGWTKVSDIVVVIVEDGCPSRLSANSPKALSKKADEILASYVPFEVPERPAHPKFEEYQPTAESTAAARELGESPGGPAFRAEEEAIANRQAAAAAGKPFKDRGAFLAQIEFSRTWVDNSMSANTTVGGRKGEPLIVMLLGSVSYETRNGQKELQHGEFIELDLREVAGANRPPTRPSFKSSPSTRAESEAWQVRPSLSPKSARQRPSRSRRMTASESKSA